MKHLMAILFLFFCVAASGIDVDFGRGDVPVTVPKNYNAENAAPLVILLHGYGSNGPQQDFYLGLSRVADRYGFLMVAPTGTLEDRGEGSERRPTLSGIRQGHAVIFSILRSTITATSSTLLQK